MSNVTDTYEQLLAAIRGSNLFHDLMENPNVSLGVTLTNANPGTGENFRQTTVFDGKQNCVKPTESKNKPSELAEGWERCFFFGRPSLLLRGRDVTEKERDWRSDNHFFMYGIREICGKPISVEKSVPFIDRYGTLVTWVNILDITIGTIDFLNFNKDFNDFVVDEEPDRYYRISDIKDFKTAFDEKEMLSKAKAKSIYPCTECNRCLNCKKTSEFKKAYEGMLQYATDHPEFMPQTPESVATSTIMCNGCMIGYFR